MIHKPIEVKLGIHMNFNEYIMVNNVVNNVVLRQYIYLSHKPELGEVIHTYNSDAINM